MHRASLPLLLALALASLVAGCVRETARIPPAWDSHASDLAARNNWDLQGKIGVRAVQESGSALLSWRQRDSAYRLVLSGALGLGKLVLEGDENGVSWTARDGTRRTHPDPAALIRELWGWEVPIGSLRYWVRGLPDPAWPLHEPVVENGLATRFRQAGWIIEPQDYRAVDGLELPSRVRVQNDAAVLTVAISRWSFAAP